MASSEGEEAARIMTDKANFERFQKDLDGLKSDMSALTEHLRDTIDKFSNSTQKGARSSLKQARAGVNAFVDDATKRGADALEVAQDAAATLEESIEDAIVQRPLATVGLAIGLGFLIGITWRR